MLTERTINFILFDPSTVTLHSSPLMDPLRSAVHSLKELHQATTYLREVGSEMMRGIVMGMFMLGIVVANHV